MFTPAMLMGGCSGPGTVVATRDRTGPEDIEVSAFTELRPSVETA